jgi:DNA-binding CsgD family transcriptional regulator
MCYFGTHCGFAAPDLGGRPMTTLDQFSGLVGDIYDAALDPALWDQTLKRVFSAAGGNNAALVLFDRQKRRPPQIIAAPPFEPAQIRKYDAYYGQFDPLAPTLERSRVGEIVTARAVTTESQRHGEFYNDWAHPNKTGDTVFVNILDSTSGVCNFMMGHPWRSDPFVTPDVLQLVSLLAPHLQRALQAQLGFGPLSLIRDGALDLVERWRHGCVLVTFAGHVLYANRAASEIAASRDGLSLGTRGLRAALAPDDAALQRLIRLACIGDGPRSSSRIAISRGSGRRPYTIQVMPLRSCHARFLNGPAAALVLVVDHEREAHLPPADLQEVYDLTPAEAEVAVRVLRGHGLQYVAGELRVSLSTVRVHLQRVFEKTGTHRQAELVRLLIELDASQVAGEAVPAADTQPSRPRPFSKPDSSDTRTRPA